MQRMLEDLEKCKGELNIPQRAEEGLQVYSKVRLLLQSLEELEHLTQQQASLLEVQHVWILAGKRFCSVIKEKNGPTKGAYDAVLTLLIYFNVALLYEATLILVANWILVSTRWICFFMSLCHLFHSFLNVLVSLTNLEQDQRRGRNKCDSCNHNRLSYSWTDATARHTSSPGNI